MNPSPWPVDDPESWPPQSNELKHMLIWAFTEIERLSALLDEHEEVRE